MIEKFEYKGYWWLPNRPETKIPGTLTFNPDEGAILDLEGSFKDVGDLKRLLRPEVILGPGPFNTGLSRILRKAGNWVLFLASY